MVASKIGSKNDFQTRKAEFFKYKVLFIKNIYIFSHTLGKKIINLHSFDFFEVYSYIEKTTQLPYRDVNAVNLGEMHAYLRSFVLFSWPVILIFILFFAHRCYFIRDGSKWMWQYNKSKKERNLSPLTLFSEQIKIYYFLFYFWLLFTSSLRTAGSRIKLYQSGSICTRPILSLIYLTSPYFDHVMPKFSLFFFFFKRTEFSFI